MKIAFIGGTRFIGLEAVRQSAARRHEVWVLHRGIHSCLLPESVREILVNRHDQEQVQEALHSIRPDVVIDTLAMTSSDAGISANAMSALNLRAVVLSSHDVYAQFGLLNGLPAPEPEEVVTENSPLTIPYPLRGLADRDGWHDYDKKEVEREFREAVDGGALKSVTVLRLPATYGSGDYQLRLGSLVERLDSGKREILCQDGASWRWTMGHAADVAYAVVLAAESEETGFSVYNVGEACTPTMRERADLIAEIMGVKIEWKETADDLPEEFSMFGRARTDFVVDTTLIRRRLGFKERLSSRDAIKDLVQWSCSSFRHATR